MLELTSKLNFNFCQLSCKVIVNELLYENLCLHCKELQLTTLLCPRLSPDSGGMNLAHTPLFVPWSPLDGTQADIELFSGPGAAGSSEGEAHLPSHEIQSW